MLLQTAQAQVDAGTLLNQQQRQQQRLPQRFPEATPVTPAQNIPSKPHGQTIKLRAVRFTGAVHLASEAELQSVVAPALDHELDFDGLQQLAAQVTAFLKRQGWFLARAYLPHQDLNDGILEISLLEGRLDGSENNTKAYRIVADDKGSLRIDLARLSGIADQQLAPGATARLDRLERAVLLMNDLAGISSSAHLEAGSEPDSTRVIFEVKEGPLLAGNAWLDNYGTRDTGANQINVMAQFNDPTHQGDQGTLNLTHTQGLDLVRLGYVLPVGNDGLQFVVSASALNYKVIRGIGLSAGLQGDSQTFSVRSNYPLLRSRNKNLVVSVERVNKAFSDESVVGVLRDKRLDNWSLGLGGDALDGFAGGGYNTGGLSWSNGKVDLSRNSDNAAADASGYATAGHFNKIDYTLARLQKLPGNFTLAVSLSGQSADRNLDFAEKFILGGPNGVRAYSSSEAIGDEGRLSSVELRYDLPALTTLGKLQIVGFYDNGRVKLNHNTRNIVINTATGANSYKLAGYGLGLNLIRTARYGVRCVWARKKGQNPGRSTAGLDVDGADDRSRVWFQGSALF